MRPSTLATRTPATDDEAFVRSAQAPHPNSNPETQRLPVLRLVRPLPNALSQSYEAASSPSPAFTPMPPGRDLRTSGSTLPVVRRIAEKLLAAVVIAGLALALLQGALIIQDLRSSAADDPGLQLLMKTVALWGDATAARSLDCHGGKATSARWICVGEEGS